MYANTRNHVIRRDKSLPRRIGTYQAIIVSCAASGRPIPSTDAQIRKSLQERGL